VEMESVVGGREGEAGEGGGVAGGPEGRHSSAPHVIEQES
jgi:hypothetical protein